MKLGWLLAVALPFIAAVLSMTLGCAGTRPAVDAATCSPRAEAWWLSEMTKACGAPGQKDALKSGECPAAAAIDAEYLRREELECSAK